MTEALDIALSALKYIAERQPVQRGFWKGTPDADEPAHNATTANITAITALRRIEEQGLDQSAEEDLFYNALCDILDITEAIPLPVRSWSDKKCLVEISQTAKKALASFIVTEKEGFEPSIPETNGGKPSVDIFGGQA